MKNKFVGIKEFQSKLAESFPQPGTVTIVTKRNIPTYSINYLAQAANEPSVGVMSSSLGEIKNVNLEVGNICPTCGQEVKQIENTY